MMGVKLKISGDVIFNSAFDGINGFTRGNTGAISDAKNVGIYSLGRLAPPHVQHDVGSLTSNTGQRLQRCT